MFVQVLVKVCLAQWHYLPVESLTSALMRLKAFTGSYSLLLLYFHLSSWSDLAKNWTEPEPKNLDLGWMTLNDLDLDFCSVRLVPIQCLCHLLCHKCVVKEFWKSANNRWNEIMTKSRWLTFKYFNLNFKVLLTTLTTTPWVKKTCHQTFVYIFTKYQPILKILSLSYSVVNLQ